MRDNRRSVDSQQGYAAVLGIIETFEHLAQSRSQDSCRQFVDQGTTHLLTYHANQRFGQSFAEFEHDITHKAITDNYIGATSGYIASLDVADKIQIQDWGIGFEQAIGINDLLIALAFFLPVSKQADTWLLHVEDTLHVDRSHEGKLQ